MRRLPQKQPARLPEERSIAEHPIALFEAARRCKHPNISDSSPDTTATASNGASNIARSTPKLASKVLPCQLRSDDGSTNRLPPAAAAALPTSNWSGICAWCVGESLHLSVGRSNQLVILQIFPAAGTAKSTFSVGQRVGSVAIFRQRADEQAVDQGPLFPGGFEVVEVVEAGLRVGPLRGEDVEVRQLPFFVGRADQVE